MHRNMTDLQHLTTRAYEAAPKRDIDNITEHSILAGLNFADGSLDALLEARARCRAARYAIRKGRTNTDRQHLLDVLGVDWDDANPGPSYLAQQRAPYAPPEQEPSASTPTGQQPEGEVKACSRCRETKPVTEFPRDSATKDGLHYQCRQCRKGHPSTAWRPARHVNVPDKKGCSTCRVVKPAAAFASDRTRSSGLSAACRDCRSIALRAYRARLKFGDPVPTS